MIKTDRVIDFGIPSGMTLSDFSKLSDFDVPIASILILIEPSLFARITILKFLALFGVDTNVCE